jgi:hypothetical protein
LPGSELVERKRVDDWSMGCSPIRADPLTTRPERVTHDACLPPLPLRREVIVNFWYDGNQRPTVEETYLRLTPRYLELRKESVEPPVVTYTYLLPWSEHALLVCACWGHDFDAWMQLFQQQPKNAMAWFSAIKETYPTLGRLLENGLHERYAQGALLNIEDPDDAERKWIVGTVVGNLDLDSDANLQDLLSSERFMQAYETVIGNSMVGGHEFLTRSLSAATKFKSAARVMFNSQVETFEMASIWIPRITRMFGSG